MPRPATTHPRRVADLADFREVVGGVNAMLDAMLAAALPVLAHALARRDDSAIAAPQDARAPATDTRPEP